MAWGRLALLQAADDDRALTRLAEVFGYARLPDDDDNIRVQGGAFQSTVQINVTTDVSDAPKRLPARFLRVNKIVNTETSRDDFLTPKYLSQPDMSLQASAGTYRFAAPLPLMPMARLLPLLFNSLAQAKTGHGLDHRLLLKRLEQGKALQRLPKRQHHRWPQRLQIIVDADPRLEPYWADFEIIVRQMQTLLGKEAVQALRFDENALGGDACYCLPWPAADHDQWRLWQAPLPDVAVLILSDLGFGDDRAAVSWRRQLLSLQQHPGSMLTLSPASASSGDKLFCRQLKPNAFNDHYPMPRHPVRTGFAFGEPSAQAIQDILAWLAPLPLIDSGLLRRLRVEMQWGDSSLEAAVWSHPSMCDIGLGICLQQQVVGHYQERFQNKYAGSKKAELYWSIIEDHHSSAYSGLRQLEKLKLSLFEQQEVPEMLEYYQRFCATVMQSGGDPAQQRALRMQGRTVLASMPQSIWNSTLQESAYHIFAVCYEDEIRAGQWPEKLPAGFNPDRLRWVVGDSPAAHEKQAWQIVQIGDQGRMKCEPCSMENNRVVNIFKIEEVEKEFPPRLILSDANSPVTHLLQTGITVTLPENEKAVFEVRGLKLELEAINRPGWASRIWRNADGLWGSLPWLNQEKEVFWQASKTEADGYWRWPTPFGEDSFGVYADLSVNNVTQRFRWLEPGTFFMGSPEHESEREWRGMDGGKGTENRHPVTLSQGFWLADTTVSQGFWQAVSNDNPSKFTDNPNNPVEQVSWEDAQVFIGKLNNLFPGLAAMLPSEAQWEYACRAGTDTPFSFGANITLDQVNYNGNYPYADGKKGLFRQRTVPVKSLPANPWGLYEMHGNVWEWCADVWQQQLATGSVTDPLNTDAEGVASRVVRGGSWDGGGRSVRSAFRGGDAPDGRYRYLGFRLALGHAELRPGQGCGTTGQEVATGVGPGRRVAEQRQTGPTPVADGDPTSNVVKRFKKYFGKGDKKKK